MNVLIVDDDAIARNGMKKCIDWKNLGIKEVYLASDGAEAVEMVDNYSIDIVITDIKMPRMDGLQLAEYINKNKPETKVIFVSAYADFEYARSGIKYGVKEYLVKPISYENINEIKRIVRECNDISDENNSDNQDNASDNVRLIFESGDMVAFKKLFGGVDFEQAEAAEQYCNNIVKAFFDYIGTDTQGLDSVERIKTVLAGKKSIDEMLQYTYKVISRFYYITRMNINGNTDSMLEYIKVRLDNEFSSEDLTASVIAEEFDMNDVYLSNLFEKKYGVRIFEYLVGIRMQKACEYLHDTDWGVGKIANECGYADSSYFVRKFKKKFGVTPLQYRENNK